ncbi:hypothetical protein JB92DRAFT_569016 [Gautieria morchelliformis]|nr:hypothetical protein JB92DRAFT_569016 [Gautieria morchelliformis]
MGARDCVRMGGVWPGLVYCGKAAESGGLFLLLLLSGQIDRVRVAPRIGAKYHQHLFSVRIYPMDGLRNSVIESDTVPLPNAPTGSADNWAGPEDWPVMPV